MAVIGYSTAATPVNGAATSLTVTAPACESGNLLVMGVIGGGTGASAVHASTPSGWTALTTSGNGINVFTKTAGSSETSYTVTMSATCTIAAYVAAYPAATVESHSFAASSSGSTAYTGSWPSAGSGQLVLAVAAAVASGSNAGYQNVTCPPGLTTEVPVFGQALPDNASSVYPCAIGLSDAPGSTVSGLPAPVLTSPQDCTIYAGFLVLTVTGTASPLYVTAASAYPAGYPGLVLTVKALTGAQSPAQIASGGAAAGWYADRISQAPATAITPSASGSYVYGAVTENFAVSGTSAYTAASGTTFSQNLIDTANGVIYGTIRSTGTTTEGTALTLGGSAPDNAYTTAALAEILAAPGSSLAEAATATAAGLVPGDFATAAVAQTAVFLAPPAAGALLVAMVSAGSNFNAGNAAVTVTDSSGLTWTQLAQQGYPSYSGVFVAQVANPGLADGVTATALVKAPGGTVGTGGTVEDESDLALLDESGADILDESAAGSGPVTGATARVLVTAVAGTIPGPVTLSASARASVRAPGGTAGGTVPPPPPAFSGTWTAARNGMPGDGTAENAAAQASQFLVTHGISAVRAGNRIWYPAVTDGGGTTVFGWNPPLLSTYDVSQPFTLPSGVTATGRAALPLLPSGNGADLDVRLCPDNGSGEPETTTVLAGTVIPASHVTALSAGSGIASASGPLQVSRYNASLLGPPTSQPWAAPAVSAGGGGNYAAPVTSGNWTIFIGGINAANTPVTTVSTVQYQGSGTVGGAVTASLLPQAAYFMACAVTSDTIVAAGGYTGSAWQSAAWTASWDGNGTVGAWSAQAALPQVCAYGAMTATPASSANDCVYVSAGTPDGTAASGTGVMWWGSVSGGSVSAWNSGPRLPVPCSQVYLACVGNWLVCAGGISTAGAALSYTWIAELGGDGTPGPWTAGPPLPIPMYALVPGWNTAVTDSAVIITGGTTTGGQPSPYAVSLSVSADGPAPEWQVQGFVLAQEGEYQAAAYPSGPAGWTVAGFHVASYATAQVSPVPMVSVPLPASGLTSGGTYHLVLHQEGGDAADYLAAGLTASGAAPLLYSGPGSGGPWTAATGLQIAAVVYDQTASGALLHLYEDSGSRVTTLARDASGDLVGVLDSTVFPAGSPEAVLSDVTQVTWSGGLPSGLVTLA